MPRSNFGKKVDDTTTAKALYAISDDLSQKKRLASLGDEQRADLVALYHCTASVVRALDDLTAAVKKKGGGTP